MKSIIFSICLLMAWRASSQTVSNSTNSLATKVAATVSQKDEAAKFAAEVDAATQALKENFASDNTNATNFVQNLKSIQGLIVKHLKSNQRELLARLYLLDAHIYADGMHKTAKARAIWSQVVREFPGTLAAQGAAVSLARLNARLATEPNSKVPVGLAVGQRFPQFKVKDLAGNPLSPAAHRGRITLIDFWATWCGPCRAELPNVIALYAKRHAQGFDIIGVSLDDNRATLVSFLKRAGMTWPQYFDGGDWNNKLAQKYKVNSIPMTYLLDQHGIIIGKGLRGRELDKAVAKALNST